MEYDNNGSWKDRKGNLHLGDRVVRKRRARQRPAIDIAQIEGTHRIRVRPELINWVPTIKDSKGQPWIAFKIHQNGSYSLLNRQGKPTKFGVPEVYGDPTSLENMRTFCAEALKYGGWMRA